MPRRAKYAQVRAGSIGRSRARIATVHHTRVKSVAPGFVLLGIRYGHRDGYRAPEPEPGQLVEVRRGAGGVEYIRVSADVESKRGGTNTRWYCSACDPDGETSRAARSAPTCACGATMARLVTTAVTPRLTAQETRKLDALADRFKIERATMARTLLSDGIARMYSKEFPE